jgi:hypothetical protein
MEITKEIILAIIGLLGVAAITITITVNKKNNNKVTKTSIKQKGNNPQAFINSKIEYHDTKEKNSGR